MEHIGCNLEPSLGWLESIIKSFNVLKKICLNFSAFEPQLRSPHHARQPRSGHRHIRSQEHQGGRRGLAYHIQSTLGSSLQ